MLTAYGRASGFCADPIEKKPLFQFLPGSAVLSFGTAGCNLVCRFCQNWDISKSREYATLAEEASPEEVYRLISWITEHLGRDVPLHFSAFHPDFKMMDVPSTPPGTLAMARQIALNNGIPHVYTGNVHDPVGQSTYCHRCGSVLIERDGYRLGRWGLDSVGRCKECRTLCVGVFDPGGPGTWGARRLPVTFTD